MKVTVKVPATTANIGPGYDALGMALSVFNEVTFEIAPTLTITGCDPKYQNEDNLVWQGFKRVYESLGLAAPYCRVDITFDIPIARGLGSSSACLVAGMLAANTFLGDRLSEDNLFQLLNQAEGHPDNVAAALYGGLTASFMHDGKAITVKYQPHPDWRFLAIIPNYEVSTHQARALMHPTVTLKNAVFNLSHAVATVTALERGDAALLRLACEDQLHEPVRATLIPEFDAIKAMAKAADVDAFVISGSGSTLLAMSQSEERLEALAEQCRAQYPHFLLKPLLCCREGATVFKRD